MSIVLLFLIIFILFLGFIFVTLSYKRKHFKLFNYLYNLLNIITSARYGNLNVKAPVGIDGLTKNFSKNINALLESIIDRDKMIQEYIEKEKERQNLKQDFISTLTHDLKVPIIAQDNTYDLLLNETFGKLNTQQETAIKNLKISNEDLKQLVLNILDVQKLETNSLSLNKENTELNSLVKEVIEQNSSILTIQNKTINFSSNENEVFYDVDKFLIKRVLNNLISNAITHAKSTNEIDINLIKTNKEIKISVIDKGNGINEEDINNIFKKYYTSSKKYTPTSTGLGLYISNKIITAHSGKIIAKNNKEKGATFTIILPL